MSQSMSQSNQTKSNQIKSNQTKSNQTKKIKPKKNQTKKNQTKKIKEIKSNQIKSNQIYIAPYVANESEAHTVTGSTVSAAASCPGFKIKMNSVCVIKCACFEQLCSALTNVTHIITTERECMQMQILTSFRDHLVNFCPIFVQNLVFDFRNFRDFIHFSSHMNFCDLDA